jgi:hypothetical protein
MTRMRYLATIAAVLALAIPAAAGQSPPAREGAPTAVAHEELGRAFEELAGHLRGLGSRFREHFLPGDPQDRPLITLMLHYRSELGLTPQQIDTLERLRSDFQREAIRRDAALRVAEMDLAALRRREPVDLGQVEAKVREIERLRAEQRLARIRAIEQGKAELTPEQREKLCGLLAGPPAPHRL